ncbi:MAG: NBR1-Ig-like domain-containing protein [Anaerolineales bacterium]|nr:NBR1-Ig-like domain-containing protein [Anaerolineales bacterium]
MNGQRIRKISIWLVTALYLLACVAPFIAAPTASPTQMPVGTIIAQTAAAAQTQTAILLPTSTPTLTPTKTPTPTPTFIPLATLATTPVTETVTPTGTLSSPTPTQTEGDSSGSGDGSENGEDGEDTKSGYSSVIDKQWACTVLEKYPKNGTIIGKGVRFSAVWKLLNRGIRTWPIHSVDLLFKAGLRPPGRAIFDMPRVVISGGTITLDVTITAPEVPGAYRSIWTLKVGRTFFCKMGINFVVQ